MEFDQKYTEYWASSVKQSKDGLKIPGVSEAKYFLQHVGLKKDDKVLDLGCSFGRMFEALSEYSDNIFGVDPDLYAVEKASIHPYIEVRQGTAESTGFSKGFFDAVFCWAVFDVVNHKKSLKEINQILKVNGKLLFTGKNSNYFSDDELAFVAEKNAFLKNFPNRFTDIRAIISNFEQLGFKLDNLFIFPRRGDFGLLSFVDQGLDLKYNYIGYEYLIVCHKISDQPQSSLVNDKLESSFSATGTEIALSNGFYGAKEYFESIGIS